MVNKLTPVLFVKEIEPCLPFWTALGMEKTVEVPEGDRLGFVMLVKDGVELMYQSFASAAKDVPALAEAAQKSETFLFVEVRKLDEVLPKLKTAPVVVPERKTFYGAREIGVREPGGHFVMFAEFEQHASSPK